MCIVLCHTGLWAVALQQGTHDVRCILCRERFGPRTQTDCQSASPSLTGYMSL